MEHNPKVVPWSFQYEVVEGCSLACPFCGIHAIRRSPRDKNFKEMPIELMKHICKQINEWRPYSRHELNNHGETTLHSQWFEYVREMRKCIPNGSIQVQTNMLVTWECGDPIGWIKEAFSTGLNIFVANCYRQKIWDQMKEWYDSKYLHAQLPGIEVIDFYYDNPNNVSAYHNHRGRKILFINDDLGRAQEVIGSKGRAKAIINEGGNTSEKYMEKVQKQAPMTAPLKKPCSRVYREMTFGYNGVVAACCYDWKNALIFGDASVTPIKEIWESRIWNIARGMLSSTHKWRNMSPCDVCDYGGGFRIGLLPKVDVDFDPNDPAIHEEMADHMRQFRHHQYQGYEYRIGDIVYNDGMGPGPMKNELPMFVEESA